MPIFLCNASGHNGQVAAAPLRMKTGQPGLLSYVGFPSKEIGSYFIQRRGLAAAQFDFIEMQPFYTSTTIEERQGVEKVLYFPDKKTVDLFVDDNGAFPYAQHDVFIVLLLPPPEDLKPALQPEGLLGRFAKLFR